MRCTCGQLAERYAGMLRFGLILTAHTRWSGKLGLLLSRINDGRRLRAIFGLMGSDAWC